MPSKNKGWIYVMRSDAYESNIYKIGKTKRNPEIRAKELSTSLSQNMEVIFKKRVSDISKSEKKVFDLLIDNKIEGKELFQIYDFNMIESVFNYVSEIYSIDKI